MINVSEQRCFRAGAWASIDYRVRQPTWLVEVCVPNRLRTRNRRIEDLTACFIAVAPACGNRSERRGLVRRWHQPHRAPYPQFHQRLSRASSDSVQKTLDLRERFLNEVKIQRECRQVKQLAALRCSDGRISICQLILVSGLPSKSYR
jgi:hypothetical protein